MLLNNTEKDFTDKIRKIRKKLPHGSIKAIAVKTGVTPVYVSRVLAGVYYNEAIINEAVHLYAQIKKRSASLDKKLNKALEK